MEREVHELLQRGVVALEKLAEDEFQINLEVKPPHCPYCEKMNPKVRVGEITREGPLAEYVVQVQCLNCNTVFYMIPFQVDCVRTVADAEIVLEEKRRLSVNENGNPEAPIGSDAVGPGSL